MKLHWLKIAWELAYLALVYVVFLAANGKFETVVIAMLVLTYTATKAHRDDLRLEFTATNRKIRGWFEGLAFGLGGKPLALTEEEKELDKHQSVWGLISLTSIALGTLFAVGRILMAVFFDTSHGL